MGLYGGPTSSTWRGGTVRKASSTNKSNNFKKPTTSSSASKPKIKAMNTSKGKLYGGPQSSTWRGGTVRKSSSSSSSKGSGNKGTTKKSTDKVKPSNEKKVITGAPNFSGKKTNTSSKPKTKSSSSSKSRASSSSKSVGASSGKSKKLKNKNYYKYIGIRKKPEWKANVTNNKDVDVPTLSFKSEFVTAANDLVTKMKTVKKDLKTVNQNLKNIKKKGGDAITTKSIDNVRVSFETSSDAFYKSCKALRDGALNTYNEWLQALYDSMAQTALTNQGTESDAQVDEVESNFE